MCSFVLLLCVNFIKWAMCIVFLGLRTFTVRDLSPFNNKRGVSLVTLFIAFGRLERVDVWSIMWG